LHYFSENQNSLENDLKRYCTSVTFYKRDTSVKNIFSKIPYIVQSRSNSALLGNLLKNDFPILFEGLHTTFFLNHQALKNRNKIVRLHNIEWVYYLKLYELASGIKEKIYFYTEYRKLLKYQKILSHTQKLICLSETDNNYYADKFPNISTEFVPAFHQNNEVKSLIGKGNYILFHGNLSITDNYLPIVRLLKNELKHSHFNIIIAGKNPAEHLKETVKSFGNVQLIANPEQTELEKYISEAHINVVLSEIETGVKLKLLNALFLGRFCFANQAAVVGTKLENIVVQITENTIEEALENYMTKAFTQTMIDERNQVLSLYNNQENARKIMAWF